MKKVSYIDSNFLSPRDAWDALSVAEKAEMMKAAIRNGITNLQDIRAKYNEFAGGGYMDKAKALIKKNEGWMAKPYKDAPKGKSWRSVGYGFNDSGFYDKYPEGISRHYENGITKAQAEQELSYILNKADKHLRSIYGKQWDSFNDNQKAAIMDTYYQRPASVGKKSVFYNAVKSGKDASKYLGVNGFTDRNRKRQSVFSGGAIPAVAEVRETSLPQATYPQFMAWEEPEFVPMNPFVFETPSLPYQGQEIAFGEPVEQETPINPYSPEEIERQERAEGLSNLQKFLSFMGSSGTGNSFLDTMGMLASNTFAKGGSVVTSDLLDRVTQEEGFEPHPVDIGDGKMTLGSGLTSKEWRDLYEKRGRKWSQEDNRRAVQTELMRREQWAEKNVPNWNILPDSSKKALLSYKYNYDFTKTNSPKLFQALEAGNFREAARQMDATSKNPKFKRGLTDRRKREQEWFLSDIIGNETPAATPPTPVETPTTIGITMPSITEPAVSTAVRNNYVPATTTPYNRGNNMRRGFESAVAYNRMMDATSLQNNPLPEYQFPISYAEGGDINPGMTGMMKSKLATAAHFGNPTARRITNYDARSYTWPGEYEYDNGIGELKRGNVFVGSYGNLVTPQIQDDGKGLIFVDDVWSPENDQRSYIQSLKFSNEKDARYFGDHYKEIAPMMNLYSNGGKIHIKPSHRGRLTELKKRTGKSEAELYKTGGPAVRKMITFARSARKWNKHDLGGYL